MSRLLIAASLITAFTSFVSADRAEARWAQPPTVATVEPIAIAPRAPLPDRAAVRAKLAANRAANLARFRAYQRAGVFPSNTYTDSSLNVWLDADGHLCAAATIIQASGKAALVASVAEQNNFIRLGDVTQGPLLDWILTSGLTQGEIAAIQEPFEPVSDEPGIMQPRIVDHGLRKREDARLRAKYRQVDAAIVKNQQQSLDLAVDRLMSRSALARQLLAS
jgi:hypothetical protein